MRSRTWNKVESSLDTAVLQLLEVGLCTEVLCLAPMNCYPLQQPVVALVFAGNLQGDHAKPSERHDAILAACTKESQAGSHPNQSEAGSEVRVVFERQEEVAERHG